MKEHYSDKPILRELGKRIAQHRLNRDISQEALAESAGVSTRTVQRLEDGNSTQLSLFIRILRALDMLENLDVLVPELGISPIQKLKLQGKQRKRASASRRNNKTKPWTWRDEK